jgi:hypothetical protein
VAAPAATSDGRVAVAAGGWHARSTSTKPHPCHRVYGAGDDNGDGAGAQFPDWSGQWARTYGGNRRCDQSKPIHKQEAPLKPEYQARFEASIADQDTGGHGLDRGYTCLPQGMPRMMSGVTMFEFLFSPNITHILFERPGFAPRRIYTDGRDWPKTQETWFTGYSIGKWLATDGGGRYDTLEIETRRVRGLRVWDQSGMPTADDTDRDTSHLLQGP